MSMKKTFISLMAWSFLLIACSKESLPPQGPSENSSVPPESSATQAAMVNSIG